MRARCYGTARVAVPAGTAAAAYRLGGYTTAILRD